MKKQVQTKKIMLGQASSEQKKVMADEIQRRARCLAYCFRQVKEAFDGQLTNEDTILQVVFAIYHEILEQEAITTVRKF